MLGLFRCDCRPKLGASTGRGHCAIEPGVLPKPERDRYRIDGELPPPCRLVTLAVKLTVVDSTQRYCELVADPAAQRPRLEKPKVMGVGWRSAAHQACLPGYELPVFLIAQANRFAQHTDGASARRFLASVRIGPTGRNQAWIGTASMARRPKPSPIVESLP